MSGNVFPQHVFPLDSNWFSSPDIICALWLVAIFSSRNYSSVFAISTWVWPPECASSPEVPSFCEDKQYISHYCMVPCSMTKCAQPTVASNTTVSFPRVLKVRTRQGLHECFCVLLSISPVFYQLRTNSWQNQLGGGRVALSSQSGEVHYGEEGIGGLSLRQPVTQHPRAGGRER